MAVVPMQKVKLLVHQSDIDVALAIVQQAGAIEFREIEGEEKVTLNTPFTYANLLPRVEHVQHYLKTYETKRGLLQTLREGSKIELSETDAEKVLTDTDAIEAIVADIEKVQIEQAEKAEVVRALQEELDWLEAWKALPMKLSQLETHYTVTKLVQLDHAVSTEHAFVKHLDEALKKTELIYLLTEVGEKQVAVTLAKGFDTAVFTSVIDELDAEIVDVLSDRKETPEVEITAVAESLAAAKGELALVHDQAEYFAKEHLARMSVALEVLSWNRDRHNVCETASATKHTALFSGWLNVNTRETIETKFAEKNIAATLIDIEPEEDEEPPVEIANSPLIAPFEAVTRLYGMPGYKDLDPTVFLAGFFFLFFGLCLTDVGYGAFLMVISAIVLIFFKVDESVRMFLKLLLFVGFATVLVGMLFGGYLGIDPRYIPDFLKQLQLYDPIGNPLPVFYTALGLGVFQVMVGMIIKIYSDAKNDQLLEGVLDQGPWLFVFVLGILYLGTATGYVNILTEAQIVNLLYVGVAMVALASGRKGETIFGKIKGALLSLYGSIGYFSDILSYSRLLALGLATTALAFAVNLIASMVSDVPFIGGLLALLVLVIGHVFTLAVNTLGAFIHSARLQFVEFFGKFIAGTGKPFAPLERTKKYVAVTKSE